MPTENPRITITVSPELQAQLDDYKYKYRLKNQTQTIVSLIEKGMSSFDSANLSYDSSLSRAENDLIAKYRTLDPSGRTLVDWVVAHEADRVSLQKPAAFGPDQEAAQRYARMDRQLNAILRNRDAAASDSPDSPAPSDLISG